MLETVEQEDQSGGEGEKVDVEGKEAVVKQNVYLPPEIQEEIQAAAAENLASPSWIMRRAWEIARERIKKFPGRRIDG